MRIFVSIDDIVTGASPVLMISPNVPRDSVWLLVREFLGDRAQGAVGDPQPALPSDPPPATTVQPRILNHDEIVAAIDSAYPPALRERGLGGTVGVQFLIGSGGEVLETRTGQISAYPALDEAALEVARVYRFSPANAGDRPLAVWVVHAIDFRP
jgi:TonB family protein